MERFNHDRNVRNGVWVASMPAEPASRSWRRYLRVSVRGLIALVVVIGTGLGWLVRSARIQRDAVAAIENAGGSLVYDWAWSSGMPVPGGKPWAPQWLVDAFGVDYFGHVTAVGFPPSSRAPDAAIAHVGRLSRLQTLSFNYSPLSDEGLKHLKRLTRLSELHLADTKVTDTGLAELKGLTNLSVLTLGRTKVTDTGLAHLDGLNELRRLDVRGTQITDAGLAHLSWLTKLSYLDLGGTEVSDTGLVRLKSLTNLSELHLDGTKIADPGLVHLTGLTNLRTLSLSDTHVSDAGLVVLQKALPKLTIIR